MAWDGAVQAWGRHLQFNRLKNLTLRASTLWAMPTNQPPSLPDTRSSCMESLFGLSEPSHSTIDAQVRSARARKLDAIISGSSVSIAAGPFSCHSMVHIDYTRRLKYAHTRWFTLTVPVWYSLTAHSHGSRFFNTAYDKRRERALRERGWRRYTPQQMEILRHWDTHTRWQNWREMQVLVVPVIQSWYTHNIQFTW